MRLAGFGRGTLLRIQALALGSITTMCAEPGLAANLTFRSGGPCADRGRIQTEVEELVGRPLEEVTSVDFDVEISQKKGSWRLLLVTTERETGEHRLRTLKAQSCEEIVDATALAMAMTIRANEQLTTESDAEVTELESAASSEAHVAPPPSTRDRAPEPPRASPSAPIHPSGALLAIGEAGAMPRVAPGLELDGALTWRSLRVVALGAFFPPQVTRVPTSSEGGPSGERGADFQLLLGGLLACFTRRTGESRFFACGGSEVGVLSGQGFGVTNPLEGASTWAAARLDLGLRVPLTRLTAVLVRVGGAVPFSRQDFVLDDVEIVHRPGAVSGRAALGLEAGL